MVLSQDVIDESGKFLLNKGITLTESYISRLRSLGFHEIPVLDPYAASLKQNTVITRDLRRKLSDCFRDLYALKTTKMRETKLPANYINKLRPFLNKVIEETGSKLGYINDLQIREPGKGEVTHAVNVCLLSVTAGLYLKYPRPVLFDLALGAMLHDVGKLLTANEHKARLDENKIHTVLGAQLLSSNKTAEVAARIAAEHHERYDGLGLPYGLTGKSLHPLSRLVAIADYFDNAMKKTTSSDISRQEVVEDMLSGGHTRFDLNLLRAFFHITPVYPVGSLVRLNTRQLAYVVKNKIHYSTRPTIRLVERNPATSRIEVSKKDLDLIFKPNVTIADILSE